MSLESLERETFRHSIDIDVALTSQDEEQKAHQSAITHVQNGGREVRELQAADPVKERVGEDVARARARGAESAPLPVVVLAAE